MVDLAEQKCVPCKGGIPPFTGEQTKLFLQRIQNWQLLEESGVKKIRKEFKFKDFLEAISFVNKVVEVAEFEGHHPDIFISYNKVTITIFTHKIQGLHENDFILAAKIDEL